jgi:predicted nucleotidyltransferase
MSEVQRNTYLQECLSVLRRKKSSIGQLYGITLLGIFGSVARGQQQPNSDIDILVRYETIPTLSRLIQLEDDLADLLDARIDLVSESSLKEFVKQAIMQDIVWI